MSNGLLAKNGIIVTGSIEVQNAVTASAFSGDGSALTNTPQTDISALNTFTSSIQSEVDTLTAATSSYITETISTSSLLTTASVSSNTISFTKGDASTFDVTIDTGSAGVEGISSSRVNPDNIDEWEMDVKQLLSVGSWTSSGIPKVSIGEGHPRDLFFNPDGTKLFVLGNGGDDIRSVELTTAWDLTSFDDNTVEIADLVGTSNIGGGGFEGQVYSLYIANDPNDTNTYGKKWFTTGNSRDEVQVYTSSVAWDVSTIDVNAAEYISTTDFTNNPYGVSFNPSGSIMYVIVGNDTATIDIGAYNLSTNWDVTTAVYDSGSSLNLTLTDPAGNTELYPRNMTFNSDGTVLYIAGDQREYIYQLELSTPYDVSTAVQTKSLYTQNADAYSFYGQTSQNFYGVSGLYYVPEPHEYFYALFNGNDQIQRWNRNPRLFDIDGIIDSDIIFNKVPIFKQQIIATGILSNGSNRFSGNMYVNGQINTGGLNSSGLFTPGGFFNVKNTGNEDRRGILFAPSHAGWEQDSINQGLMLRPDLATYLVGGKKVITIPGKEGTIMLDTDTHYFGRYNTNAQTYVENSGSLEFYYTARADGDGQYSKTKGAVPLSGQSLNRRIFYSDRAFAHPDSSSQWTEYTDGAGNISLDATKNLAFDLLNFRETGSIPLSFKSSIENHLTDSLYATASMGLAYSLRRVSHIHTGYAIQVENDGGTTLDIGFDNDGNLDTGSILTHIGSGEGYVTKWYDQSGNGNDAYYDASYTYAGDKPKIATGGSINMNNGKPTIDTSVGGTFVMTEEFSTGTSTNPFLMTIVCNSDRSVNNDNQGMIIGTQVGNDNRFWVNRNRINWQINGGSYNIYWTGNTYHNTIDQKLFSAFFNGSQTDFERNGTAATGTANRTGPFRATLLFNAWNNTAYEFIGDVQEILIFPQSSSRADIIPNINSYYNIY